MTRTITFNGCGELHHAESIYVRIFKVHINTHIESTRVTGGHNGTTTTLASKEETL